MYSIQFDGMLQTPRNEPTHISLLGYGWIIKRDSLEIARGFGLFLRNCRTGSNIAEYLALIDGLETLIDLRIGRELVQVRGDAKCVIDQMSGAARVTSPLTIELNQRAQNLAKRFTALTWTWVPRRENRHADRLSRQSFRYLRYCPHLDQEIYRSQQTHFEGQLVPLVDLRVHTPATRARQSPTNP